MLTKHLAVKWITKNDRIFFQTFRHNVLLLVKRTAKRYFILLFKKSVELQQKLFNTKIPRKNGH